MEVSLRNTIRYGMLFIFILIIGIGNVSAAEYENYFGITMTNQEYNNLLNLGFSEDEIYYMDLTTYQNNKDLSANLVAKNIRYYKTTSPAYGIEETVELTEEEFEKESQISLLGYVETTYKTMVTTISQNGSYYRYKVSLSWKIMPSTRSYDIIGIGFEDDVHIASSVYMNYYHCNSSGTCYTSSDYYDVKSTDFGGTKVHKLPESAVSLSSTLFFDVAKDNSSQTLTSLSFCGDYAHATSNVTVSQAANHSISRLGITHGSSSISKYDDITCADLYWSGSW